MFFLKQLGDARNIRNRLLECFERAASPFISEAERSRLLSFVVVGGGPTSIEYASTLMIRQAYKVGKQSPSSPVPCLWSEKSLVGVFVCLEHRNVCGGSQKGVRRNCFTSDQCASVKLRRVYKNFGQIIIRRPKSNDQYGHRGQ